MSVWLVQRTTLHPFILSVFEQRAPESRGWFEVLPKELNLILDQQLAVPLEADSGPPWSVGSPPPLRRGHQCENQEELTKSKF